MIADVQRRVLETHEIHFHVTRLVRPDDGEPKRLKEGGIAVWQKTAACVVLLALPAIAALTVSSCGRDGSTGGESQAKARISVMVIE
jgi:hypothetical protein